MELFGYREVMRVWSTTSVPGLLEETIVQMPELAGHSKIRPMTKEDHAHND